MGTKEFIEVYLPLSDGLYRFAYHLLESAPEAQDAVQDLYVKLWNSREKLDGVASAKAYCLTLLRNLCIDRIRRLSRSPVDADLSRAPDGPQADGDALESRETLSRVMNAIASLPPAQRQVMEMKVFEELSYEEIAERTGMSNLTLRVLLSQARKKLRSVL